MRLKFRPQDLPYKYRGKGYNWQPDYNDLEFTTAMSRIWSQIHYLASHTPVKVRPRWKNAALLRNKRKLEL